MDHAQMLSIRPIFHLDESIPKLKSQPSFEHDPSSAPQSTNAPLHYSWCV